MRRENQTNAQVFKNVKLIVLSVAKACQRRPGEQPHIEDRQKRSCSEREMERRTRGGRDFNGRRTVRGCRRVAAVYERAKWFVFHRNRRIGRVRYIIIVIHTKYHL